MSDLEKMKAEWEGKKYEPYEFVVTPDYNQQYLFAIEDYDQRYLEDTDDGPAYVHPSLLLNQSNTTRSPSFRLDAGEAGVHAKEDVEFLNPARVGKRFRVTWKQGDLYEKRGKVYGETLILIVDEDGLEILRRTLYGVIFSKG